ncbi:polysaccharide lyase [Planctomycetota bacterium]
MHSWPRGLQYGHAFEEARIDMETTSLWLLPAAVILLSLSCRGASESIIKSAAPEVQQQRSKSAYRSFDSVDVEVANASIPLEEAREELAYLAATYPDIQAGKEAAALLEQVKAQIARQDAGRKEPARKNKAVMQARKKELKDRRKSPGWRTRTGVFLKPLENRRVMVTSDFETRDYAAGAVKDIRDRGLVELVRDPVRSGKQAAKYTLDPQSQRAELCPCHATSPMFGERWYGFSLFVPDGWEINDKMNEVVAQWHAEPDLDLGDQWRSPPLAVRIISNTWKITCLWDQNRVTSKKHPVGQAVLFQEPFKTGEWTDWVFHIKWSWKDDGLVEIWQNNRLAATRTGPNCYNDRRGTYFKWGLYHTKNNRVIYNDEFRMGDEQSTYGDVIPAGPRTP